MTCKECKRPMGLYQVAIGAAEFVAPGDTTIRNRMLEYFAGKAEPTVEYDL